MTTNKTHLYPSRVYYRTLIRIEVVSLGEYNPNAIYNVAQDITNGPHTGIWDVIEYGIATAEQVQSLVERNQDTNYRHYKEEKSVKPTLLQCATVADAAPRTLNYKTIIDIEILSKEEYTVNKLASLEYDMLSGHCLGVWGIKESRLLSNKEMSDRGYLTGSDNDPVAHTVRIDIPWWSMRQIPYREKVRYLQNNTGELICVLINHHYNTYCRSMCDGKGDVQGAPSNRDYNGKRVPSLNGRWGDIDFASEPSGPYETNIPIGLINTNKAPRLIGFIGYNKWALPERLLTGGEREQVMAYLDAAMAPCSRNEEQDRLKELWDYMQTLPFP